MQPIVAYTPRADVYYCLECGGSPQHNPVGVRDIDLSQHVCARCGGELPDS